MTKLLNNLCSSKQQKRFHLEVWLVENETLKETLLLASQLFNRLECSEFNVRTTEDAYKSSSGLNDDSSTHKMREFLLKRQNGQASLGLGFDPKYLPSASYIKSKLQWGESMNFADIYHSFNSKASYERWHNDGT